MAIEATPDEHLTINDVGVVLACSPDTVRRMIARGELKAVRVGKRLIRVRRADLDRAMRPVTRVELVTAGARA
ncbi:helix-turn-helix domain-containing protein [Demequina aurantiaca]|uniref:helix-turn-helix domain-containing protein n=1 Tax=Demequina aurantiaca TaxID=676200 RepID=UPI003D32BC28